MCSEDHDMENQTEIGDKRAEITRIINAIQEGYPRTSDELLPLVYEDLRMLVDRKLSQEKPR